WEEWKKVWTGAEYFQEVYGSSEEETEGINKEASRQRQKAKIHRCNKRFQK
ncbi:hypothetical protein ILUMI_14651, partial [Ignelater luminosus]